MSDKVDVWKCDHCAKILRESQALTDYCSNGSTHRFTKMPLFKAVGPVSHNCPECFASAEFYEHHTPDCSVLLESTDSQGNWITELFKPLPAYEAHGLKDFGVDNSDETVSRHDSGTPCAHKWERRFSGGSPVDSGSREVVVVCVECGVEQE